jgi:hypothetical protein
MNTPIINYLLGIGMMASLALLPKFVFKTYGTAKTERLKFLPYFAGFLPVIYTIFFEIYVRFDGKPSLNLEVFLNFLQHGIGGGVACGLITFYLYQNFKVQLPWLKNPKVKLIGVFAIVSVLGVTNEIIELILDLMNLSQYSRDRFDTWIDLVANTIGALVAFYASLKLTSFSKKS